MLSALSTLHNFNLKLSSAAHFKMTVRAHALLIKQTPQDRSAGMNCVKERSKKEVFDSEGSARWREIEQLIHHKSALPGVKNDKLRLICASDLSSFAATKHTPMLLQDIFTLQR